MSPDENHLISLPEAARAALRVEFHIIARAYERMARVYARHEMPHRDMDAQRRSQQAKQNADALAPEPSR